MIRLRRIEVWNFESHEHSVLEGFEDGLNLIVGVSDSGKTSLVRALKLVAYNEFDPASVRKGAENCVVRVDSDAGYVKVTRGKDNKWEVARIGEKPQYFEKIGSQPLPEAMDVLGLRKVELGDQEIPVNIMDQDENHFMLNEVADKKSTGSLRAQIVDEISGLSGIEGIINDVSLDRHRFGRAVKEAEEKAEEARGKMHDEDELDAEKQLLDEADELTAQYERATETIREIGEIIEEYDNASSEITDMRQRMKNMPNTKAAKAVINRAEKAASNALDTRSFIQDKETVEEELQKAQRKLDELPDSNEVTRLLNEVDRIINQRTEILNTEDEITRERKELESLQEKMKNKEKEHEDALKERDEAMADIDVCPVTLAPMSSECFRNVKLPVTTLEVSE